MPLLEDAAAELARVREESAIDEERRTDEALEAFERTARTVIDETLGVQVAEIVVTEYNADALPIAGMADLGEAEPDLALGYAYRGDLMRLWLVKPCPFCGLLVRFSPEVTSLYTLGLADSELGQPQDHAIAGLDRNGFCVRSDNPDHHLAEPTTEEKVVAALQALIREALS